MRHADGFALTADLDTHGGDPDVDIYALAQRPYSSYEVVVDGASGGIQPLSLNRVAADGTTVVQSGSAVGELLLLAGALREMPRPEFRSRSRPSSQVRT